MTAPTELDVSIRALIEEGLEILVNLTDSIAKHGNYSPESTCTFIDQAGSAFREALRNLPASEAGWRDMESAPKDGTWIIAYRPNKGGGYLDRVVVVRWDDEVSAWAWPDQPFDVYEDDYAERLAAHGLGDHIDLFEDNSFTRWMPLPSAPDRRAA